MEHIWDIVLKAKKDGLSKSDLFWEQGKEVSPYYEQSFSCLNQNHIEKSTIEINALYRFKKLFGKYLHEGFAENLEFKKYFFDLVVHFLCEIDLGKGKTRETIYLAELEQDIQDNIWGGFLPENWNAFDRQDNIMPLVLKQIRIGASLEGFREAVTRCYPDTLMYQIKEKPERILVYLAQLQTEKEQQKYDFIETMFLPIEYQTKVFWEHHFGMLGVSPTLKLGEIELL